MIIKGNPRCSVAFWSKHLMRTDQNERVSIAEIHGLGGRDVRECLLELDAIAGGTRATNGFYVASLNPTADEQLTGEQWKQAEAIFRQAMGLENQPYFVVEHEKDGRTHRHIVAGRIDADTMTAIPADFNFQKHEIAARAIEAELGLTPVESVLVRDRETPRRENRAKDWDGFRDASRGFDKEAMKRELTALWQGADSGLAFRAAMEEAGYILARGDRRDFCVIDGTGKEHSLSRCIDGFKTAQIRERMADIDASSCPSVAEGRRMARDAATGSSDTSGEQIAAARPELERDLAAGSGDGQVQQEGRAGQDEIHRELSKRWEGWTPVENPHPDSVPTLKHGKPVIASDEHSAWRAFAGRMRATAIELWHDETSGTPQESRSWVTRVFDGTRHAAGAWQHRDGKGLSEALEDIAEAAKEAREQAQERLQAAQAADQGPPPPDGRNRDQARPGASVEAPESDGRPHPGPSEAELAFERTVLAYFAALGQDDPQAEPAADMEPDDIQPEPGGWDIEL